jgi:hypothetical protein
VAALEDSAQRLGKAAGVSLAEALALISEAGLPALRAGHDRVAGGFVHQGSSYIQATAADARDRVRIGVVRSGFAVSCTLSGFR